MGDLTLANVDQMSMTILMERASGIGRSPEDTAKDALLRGLMWTPAEGVAHADRLRATSRDPADGRPLEDSVVMIRRSRDA